MVKVTLAVAGSSLMGSRGRRTHKVVRGLLPKKIMSREKFLISKAVWLKKRCLVSRLRSKVIDADCAI